MPNGKPNILVIWGDDIGITNLSCYSDGLMGYRTPNIDRIANEGMRFTDSYGQQSCTAGRSAFITGQNPYRTGLTKVGMPVLILGCGQRMPPSPSYSNRWATPPASLEKTILAIRTNTFPLHTALMSSLAILYHLNAEEEPENVDYPPEADFPNFKKDIWPAWCDAHLGNGRGRPHRAAALGARGKAEN